jgi:hypothetical protein
MAKSFDVGEVVFFQRNVDGRWELGEYLRSDNDPQVQGWHYVRADDGFRTHCYVPSRRIKQVSRMGP